MVEYRAEVGVVARPEDEVSDGADVEYWSSSSPESVVKVLPSSPSVG